MPKENIVELVMSHIGGYAVYNIDCNPNDRSPKSIADNVKFLCNFYTQNNVIDGFLDNPEIRPMLMDNSGQPIWQYFDNRYKELGLAIDTEFTAEHKTKIKNAVSVMNVCPFGWITASADMAKDEQFKTFTHIIRAFVDASNSKTLRQDPAVKNQFEVKYGSITIPYSPDDNNIIATDEIIKEIAQKAAEFEELYNKLNGGSKLRHINIGGEAAIGK